MFIQGAKNYGKILRLSQSGSSWQGGLETGLQTGRTWQMKGKPVRLARFATEKTIHAFVFCEISSKFATERLFKLLFFFYKEGIQTGSRDGRTLQTNENWEKSPNLVTRKLVSSHILKRLLKSEFKLRVCAILKVIYGSFDSIHKDLFITFQMNEMSKVKEVSNVHQNIPKDRGRFKIPCTLNFQRPTNQLVGKNLPFPIPVQYPRIDCVMHFAALKAVGESFQVTRKKNFSTIADLEKLLRNWPLYFSLICTVSVNE
jgi:hypothetical protein